MKKGDIPLTCIPPFYLKLFAFQTGFDTGKRYDSIHFRTFLEVIFVQFNFSFRTSDTGDIRFAYTGFLAGAHAHDYCYSG